jgi:CBS domain-containing protein
MAWRQVHRLPVVDALGHLEGIIALADIATLTDDAQQPANVIS